MIVAAGRGSRLGKITADAPKCLTELAGKPLLSWQISALREAGIEKIAVIGGYRHEAILPYIEVAFYNAQWADTNMVATMACASAALRTGTTILSYSDIVYHPDIVAKLCNTMGDIVISYDVDWHSLWSLRFGHPLEDAESFRIQDGLVLEIGRRNPRLHDIEGQFMGLMKITPAGWLSIETLLESMRPMERAQLDTTGLLAKLIEQGCAVHGCAISGGWIEVDSEADLQHYQKTLVEHSQKATTWSHDWRTHTFDWCLKI